MSHSFIIQAGKNWFSRPADHVSRVRRPPSICHTLGTYSRDTPEKPSEKSLVILCYARLQTVFYINVYLEVVGYSAPVILNQFFYRQWIQGTALSRTNIPNCFTFKNPDTLRWSLCYHEDKVRSVQRFQRNFGNATELRKLSDNRTQLKAVTAKSFRPCIRLEFWTSRKITL